MTDEKPYIIRDAEAKLRKIIYICGARIKLGVSAYNQEAISRYKQTCDILFDEQWDKDNNDDLPDSS